MKHCCKCFLTLHKTRPKHLKYLKYIIIIIIINNNSINNNNNNNNNNSNNNNNISCCGTSKSVQTDYKIERNKPDIVVY